MTFFAHFSEYEGSDRGLNKFSQEMEERFCSKREHSSDAAPLLHFKEVKRTLYFGPKWKPAVSPLNVISVTGAVLIAVAMFVYMVAMNEPLNDFVFLVSLILFVAFGATPFWHRHNKNKNGLTMHEHVQEFYDCYFGNVVKVLEFEYGKNWYIKVIKVGTFTKTFLLNMSESPEKDLYLWEVRGEDQKELFFKLCVQILPEGQVMISLMASEGLYFETIRPLIEMIAGDDPWTTNLSKKFWDAVKHQLRIDLSP